MYDLTLTRQSLPSERYRLLLGTAISVFASNNGFVIENIIHTDARYSWCDLVDKMSGQLKEDIRLTITKVAGVGVQEQFAYVLEMRNRIAHGFRITSNTNEQIMATKDPKSNKQFYITEQYLLDFIKENEELSCLLHAYRGY